MEISINNTIERILHFSLVRIYMIAIYCYILMKCKVHRMAVNQHRSLKKHQNYKNYYTHVNIKDFLRILR
jgi:hypothetical protein